MTMLHIDSSILGTQSVSRTLSAAVVDQLRHDDPGVRVVYRDLDAHPVPHLTSRSLAQEDPLEMARAAAVLEEFLAADTIVIGAPMYNFTIPSTLKAWIDRIAVAGRTFRYTERGPEGLAGGKRVVVASARGSVHGAATDFQEAYLRQVFAFVGIEDITFVRAEGVALGDQARQAAVTNALASVGTINVERHAAQAA